MEKVCRIHTDMSYVRCTTIRWLLSHLSLSLVPFQRLGLLVCLPRLSERDRRKNPHYPRVLSRYKRQTYAVSRTPLFFSFLVCWFFLFITFRRRDVCLCSRNGLAPRPRQGTKNKNITTYKFSRSINSLSYPMVRACAATERSDFSVFFCSFLHFLLSIEIDHK